MRSVFWPRPIRAVQVSIALTTLAVPASALALTTSTSADSPNPSLPLHVAPRDVRLGQPITVTGVAAARVAGHRVELQTARGAHAGFIPVASTRVGRHGRFAFHVRLRHSGVLRAVELGDRVTATTATGRAARVSGGAGIAAGGSSAVRIATSRTTAVHVSARLQVSGRSRHEHAAIEGHPVFVAGHLLPARSGRTVALQGHARGGWRTVAAARTGGHGGFAVRWRHPSGSDRQLRVVFGGDRDNGRTSALAGETTVYAPFVASWYDDSPTTGCGYHAGLGVANKSLPCGTKVRFRHAGHTVTATVDDRGPYVAGRDFDLNENTAAALHFSGVGTVYASVR